jgi:hypothetical protein
VSRAIAAGAVAVAVLSSTAAAVPEQVTISARASIVRTNNPYASLFGSVGSGKADELVTIEAKECGPHTNFFRAVASAQTGQGGGWSTQAFMRVTTVFRARSGDMTSPEVTVRARPAVSLIRPSGRRFEAVAGGVGNFWRKRVLIQRYDGRLGRWLKMRSVVLTKSGYGGSASATFQVAVPKGTLIQAVLPRAQARPCYLAGYSNLVRT